MLLWDVDGGGAHRGRRELQLRPRAARPQEREGEDDPGGDRRGSGEERDTWAAIEDPAARLAAALDAIYAWYERVEPTLSALLRDADAVPIVAEIQAAGRLAYLAKVEDGLASGWGARGKAARRLRATLGLALDFLAWRTLHERGLSRADAVAVMSSAVGAAAG